MLLLMPKGSGGGGGGGQSSDQILEKLAKEMLQRMPVESEKYMFGLPFKVRDLEIMCGFQYVRTRARATALPRERTSFFPVYFSPQQSCFGDFFGVNV